MDCLVVFLSTLPKAEQYSIFLCMNLSLFENIGDAAVIYYQQKPLKHLIYPIISRTHINTVELHQLYDIFQKIDANNLQHPVLTNNNADNTITMHIVTDSQQCINVIQQNAYPKDEAMMDIHKKINEHIASISNIWQDCLKIVII